MGAMLILLAVIVVLVLWFFSAYNGLVRLRNQVQNAWAQIDVQLKRRHDLIPNLIETVKGYVKHERETLENITKARTAAMQADGVAALGKAEGELSGALGRLFAVAENYPELKANQNFLALQEELTSTENKVGFARQAYNDQVMAYNTSIESIPTNIVANMFKFTQKEFFEIETPTEREVPKVQF
jgi:LemA protein